MPWSNQSGGNGSNGPRGPWGRGPGNSGGGSGGATPPDLEELLRRSQEKLRGLLPGGFTSGTLGVAALVLVGLWLATGIYQVGPKEQGVILRFGRVVSVTQTGAGLNYHLPWPIEVAYTPQVTDVNQINIGYRPSDSGANDETTEASDLERESLMLTGDENIVDVNFTVFWKINDASDYLFNVENPDASIKAVAESAMREVVGRNQIALIQTVNRPRVEDEVARLMQKTLDSYKAGVLITQVRLQKVDPPAAVLDAYRDVQAARADQDRLRNEAEAYANKIIPEARGQAAKIIREAEAYKQEVIAQATGDSKRFLSVYTEYRKAPEVTRRRIYLETMSQILGPMNKTIIDEQAGKGVLPYMALPQMATQRGPRVSVTESAGDSTQAGAVK